MRVVTLDSENRVTNWIEYAGELPATLDGLTLAVSSGYEQVGDLYQSPAHTFVPVTRRQMLTALHRAGLLTTIRAAVDGSGDVEMQIAFDEALDFERDNPMLNAFAVAMGISESDVDALFMLAASL